MNIGITIRRASGGSTPVYKKNSFGLDVDADEIIKSVGLSDSDSAVFLNVCQDGTSIYVWQPIEGRGGDNSTFVIHVPKHCVLTHSQLKELFAKLREISKRSNIEINESKDALDSLCKENYTEQRSPIGWYSDSELSSMSDQFACMLYDETYNESEFLSQLLSYQSSFAKYKFVFVAPQGTSINAHDLSKTGIERYVFIEVPELDGALKKFYDKPSVEKGAKVGREFLCVWKGKYDYVDVKENVTVKDDGDGTFTIPSVQEQYVRRKVSRDLLYVTDSSNRQVSNFTVKFNGMPEENCVISHANLSKVKIQIESQDYKSKEVTEDLSSTDKVRIKVEEKGVTWKIQDKTGTVLELKGNLPRNSEESPIEGYRCQPSRNNKGDNKEVVLRYIAPKKQSAFNWFSFLLGLLSMMIICGAALIVMDTMEYVKFGKQKTPTTVVVPPQDKSSSQGSGQTAAQTEKVESAQTVAAPSNSELDKAIAYLDGKEPGLDDTDKSSWRKAKMDTYPELNGLYEDLDGFNLDAIKNKWSKLSVSKRFKQYVLDPAQKASPYTGDKTKYKPFGGIRPEEYKKCLEGKHNGVSNSSNTGTKSKSDTQTNKNATAVETPKASQTTSEQAATQEDDR